MSYWGRRPLLRSSSKLNFLPHKEFTCSIKAGIYFQGVLRDPLNPFSGTLFPGVMDLMLKQKKEKQIPTK